MIFKNPKYMFQFLISFRRNGVAETQPLVSFPNIPGLSPKSLRSAFVVKATVLSIAICP